MTRGIALVLVALMLATIAHAQEELLPVRMDGLNSKDDSLFARYLTTRLQALNVPITTLPPGIGLPAMNAVELIIFTDREDTYVHVVVMYQVCKCRLPVTAASLRMRSGAGMIGSLNERDLESAARSIGEELVEIVVHNSRRFPDLVQENKGQ